MPHGPVIMHVDADAFFASVTAALDPSLRGKPLAVVNAHLGERAIVLTASYEARKFGVKTGVRYVDAKRTGAPIIYVPLDMQSYGLFSLRISQILQRYSPTVEDASIDEWFVELTGLRRLHRCSYAEIARRIQEEVRSTLDVTVSMGIAPTKTLAKIGSDFQKPNGLTYVRHRGLKEFLARVPVADVPGFGRNTQALFARYGIMTALDVARLPESRLKTMLGKRGADLWKELNGEPVWAVSSEEAPQKSLEHGRTFTEFPRTKEALFAETQLVLLEAAARLRRLRLATSELWLALRRDDFLHDAARARLGVHTSNEGRFLAELRAMFEQAYVPGRVYRGVFVGMQNLLPDDAAQLSLFDARENKTLHLFPAIDDINEAFGKGTITRGTALAAKPKERAFVGSRQSRRFELPEIR